MNHSDFAEKHAWLCGLDEYFKHKQNDKFDVVFKALYHDNKYRKRDLIFDMHKRIDSKQLSGGDVALKSYYNTAMYSELPDYDVNPRTLIGLVDWFVEDELTARIYKFLTYFANNEREIPNMLDFFSRGQVKSKLWLVEELSNIVDGPLGNVVFYGGWYNFLAHFMFEQFQVSNIYSIDIDADLVGPSERLYVDEVANRRFHCITADANKMKWDGRTLNMVYPDRRQEQIDEWVAKQTEHYQDWLNKNRNVAADVTRIKEEFGLTEGSQAKQEVFEQFGYQNIAADSQQISWINRKDIEDPVKEKEIKALHDRAINVVVNTSCEHMDNTWYDDLPKGTFVVLQTNDYFDNEQHSNCCKDLADAVAKYPMSDTYYSGELDTQLYNRFMLIGIK